MVWLAVTNVFAHITAVTVNTALSLPPISNLV